MFVTTTTPPQTLCESQGTSKLYVLSYDCWVDSQAGKNLFPDAGITAVGLSTGETNTYDPGVGWLTLGPAWRVTLSLDSRDNML